MATGFVLVLMRELRESLLKLRQEFGDRLDQTNERLDQANASLGRIENELNELRKFMRQMALNQAKHEEQQSQNLLTLEDEVREVRERVRRAKQGEY